MRVTQTMDKINFEKLLKYLLIYSGVYIVELKFTASSFNLDVFQTELAPIKKSLWLKINENVFH